MRRLQGFTTIDAETESQAMGLLQQYGSQARVLAGGTDLLVAFKRGKLDPPPVLINLKSMGTWDSITFDPASGLALGALVRVADAENSAVIQQQFPALATAASQLGSVQVRNIATVGGNLCNASPSAELAPPLLVYDAAAVIAGAEGRRTVPLEKFFLSPGRSALATGELLAGLQVPPPAGYQAVYLKFAPRQAMDIAVVGVAVALKLENGICRGARIALGAVAPTPLRVPEAEAMLTGRKLDADVITAAAKLAMQRCSPISDVRATADFRRHIVGVLTRRAIQQLAEVQS